MALDMSLLIGNYTKLAPIGYVTRFIDILSSDATSSIPAISYTFATSSPMSAMGEIRFDIMDNFAQAGALIAEAKSDRAEQKDVWDIMMPFVNIFVYVYMFYMMIHALTGIHRGGDPDDRKKEKQK